MAAAAVPIAGLGSMKDVVIVGVANTGSRPLVAVADIAAVDATETKTNLAVFVIATFFVAAASSFATQRRLVLTKYSIQWLFQGCPVFVVSFVRPSFLRPCVVVPREVHPAELVGTAVGTCGHELLPAPAEEPPLAEVDVRVPGTPSLGIELLAHVEHRAQQLGSPGVRSVQRLRILIVVGLPFVIAVG